MSETLTEKLYKYKQDEPDDFVMTTIRVEKGINKRLKPILERYDVTRSAFIRNCMRMMVEENE